MATKKAKKGAKKRAARDLPERQMLPFDAKTSLLQILLEGGGYGVELASRIRDRTAGAQILLQGSLYPALQFLEKQQWVTAEDLGSASHGGRPRIRYTLTPEGKHEALVQRSLMARLIGAVVEAPAPAPTPATAAAE